MRVLSDVQAIYVRVPYSGDESGPKSMRYDFSYNQMDRSRLSLASYASVLHKCYD